MTIVRAAICDTKFLSLHLLTENKNTVSEKIKIIKCNNASSESLEASGRPKKLAPKSDNSPCMVKEMLFERLLKVTNDIVTG